jgi:hypothetical protein
MSGIRSISSDAWDYYSDAAAYTAWLDRVCETIEALDELRRRVDNGGQHAIVIEVSNIGRRSWNPVSVTYREQTGVS